MAAKEIRSLNRVNESTGNTEIFYPATTTDAIADRTRQKSLADVLGDLEDNLGAYDISAAHNNTTYADLAAALGTNGANVPDAVRKGGMSIKFVLSSDNKYVQYRLMSDEWSTNVTDWQGVDENPTINSRNLVESGGIYKFIYENITKIKNIELSRTENLISSPTTFMQFLPVYIKAGDSFSIKYGISSIWTRIVVNYNNDQSKRLVDTTDTSTGNIWQTFTALEDIYVLGFVVFGTNLTSITLTEKLNTNAPVDVLEHDFDVLSGTVTFLEDVLNKTNKETFLLDEKTEIFTLLKNSNLFNWRKAIQHVFVNFANGQEYTGSAYDRYSSSGYILLESGQNYKFLYNWGTTPIPVRSLAFYDCNGKFISGLQNVSTFTVPENANLIRFSVDTNGTYPSVQKTCLVGSDDSFSEYGNLRIEYNRSPKNPTDYSSNELITKGNLLELTELILNNLLSERNKYLPFEKVIGSNLLSPSEVVTGEFLNGAFTLVVLASYNTSGYIKVKPNTTYKCLKSDNNTFLLRSICEYDSTRTVSLGYQNLSPEISSFTTGASTHFVRFSFSSSLTLRNIGLFEDLDGEVEEFEAYYETLSFKEDGTFKSYVSKSGNEIVTKNDVISAIAETSGVGKVSLVKNGVSLTFTSGDFQINASLDKNSSSYYGGNHVFNFLSYLFLPENQEYECADDIAPAHVINTTIGANHGQPSAYAVFNAAHGLNNTYMGTKWTHSNGDEFYMVRIATTVAIEMISKNYGTATSPNFHTLKTGTITDGNITLTISNVINTQLWPSSKNVTQKIIVDGEKVNGDRVYYGNQIDIVEQYDVSDPVSVIQNLIDNVGSQDNPELLGDSLLRLNNIYRFLPDGNVLVFGTIENYKAMAFLDYMFAQTHIPNVHQTDKFKYYIPNSLPIEGYDFRTPISVQWSSSIPSINITSQYMADPTHPVNRIVTYGTYFGMAIGFLPIGVGGNLNSYTNQTFEIRNTTGKIYPHGVNSAVKGTMLSANDIYTGVLYRAFINYETKVGNRMSMYHFNVNGDEYIYIDYSGSMLDFVEVDEQLEGKSIEVVESVNTTLLQNIYNGGIYITTNYVTGETCFIVLKV